MPYIWVPTIKMRRDARRVFIMKYLSRKLLKRLKSSEVCISATGWDLSAVFS
jgi:hypothetical protein